MIIPLKNCCTYGESRKGASVFRVNENGTVDLIHKSDCLGKEFSLTIGYDVFGNTVNCEDARIVDRKEWLQRVKELKQFIKSFK